MTEQDGKRCSKCSDKKLYSEFHKNRANKDGFMGRCKLCRKAESKKYRENNREKLAVKDRQYYQENREVMLRKNHQYRQDNREKMIAYGREYYTENRDELLSKHRQYYAKNKNKLIAQKRQYYLKNREKIIEERGEYQRNNPMMSRARNAVYRAVKRGILSPVAELVCAWCGEQAEEYHHHSYEKEYQLDVISLCRSCHKLIHVQENG